LNAVETIDRSNRAFPAADTQVAVLGAGPYGLSVAAHLLAAGIPTVVFGKPMDFWKEMPRGMYLRSAWSASSLGAPRGRYGLDHYVQSTGNSVTKPIPLEDFVDYGLWFQREVVPDVDETLVRTMDRAGSTFRLQLEDGRTVHARHVVVATGIRGFARLPELAMELPRALATHSQEHGNFDAFSGKSVAVVGGGQSALECAALLQEAGATVELLVRREVIWLKLHDYMGLGQKLIHAPSDVGPPGLSWLIHFSRFFRLLPARWRARIAQRATRPAGARWLYDRVVGKARLTQHVEVVRATPDGGRLHLQLSDGSERAVDHLLFATGYRPHLDRLSFLSPELRRQVRDQDGYPKLDDCFESSVPGLYFVGRLADNSYGPICRFVSGAEPTARRVLTALRRAA
jgi:cation diffusion facilitator CzcD-associated flavoprotein CzcO